MKKEENGIKNKNNVTQAKKLRSNFFNLNLNVYLCTQNQLSNTLN